jgi:hypothetical protein
MSNAKTNIGTSGQNTSLAIFRHYTPKQLPREFLAEAGGNPDKAIALARKHAREIYIAQVKKLKAEYFERVKRANEAAIDNARKSAS